MIDYSSFPPFNDGTLTHDGTMVFAPYPSLKMVAPRGNMMKVFLSPILDRVAERDYNETPAAKQSTPA